MSQAASPQTTDNEPRPCPFDPGEETRLRCAQCGTPVCPKCMVMYETGFKCRNCVKSIQTHVTEVAPRHLLMACACSAAAGYTYGWFYPFLTNLRFFMVMGIPLLGLLSAYFIGRGVGYLIHSMTGYKLGVKILAATILGVLVGIGLSPFQREIQALILLTSSGQDASLVGSSAIYGLLPHLVAIASVMLFIKGIAAPYSRRG